MLPDSSSRPLPAIRPNHATCPYLTQNPCKLYKYLRSSNLPSHLSSTNPPAPTPSVRTKYAQAPLMDKVLSCNNICEMISVPVHSIHDDGGVGGKLLGEVGDVSLGVRLKLGRVEPAPVLPLELVVSSHLWR